MSRLGLQTEYHTTATPPGLRWWNKQRPSWSDCFALIGPFEWLFLSSTFFRQKGQRSKVIHQKFDGEFFRLVSSTTETNQTANRVRYNKMLNKETQQIRQLFWCHQWTLSQALHTGLLRDVVGWNELNISIMLTFYLSCHDRSVVISHIITWNVERTRLWEMTYPDICHVMQCWGKSCVTYILPELTIVFFVNRNNTFLQIMIRAREAKIYNKKMMV